MNLSRWSLCTLGALALSGMQTAALAQGVPGGTVAVDPSTTCTPGHVVPPGNSCTVNLTGNSIVCSAL